MSGLSLLSRSECQSAISRMPALSRPNELGLQPCARLNSGPAGPAFGTQHRRPADAAWHGSPKEPVQAVSTRSPRKATLQPRADWPYWISGMAHA